MASEVAIKEFAGKKMAAAICAIMFGAYGVHKFILGDSKQGITRLLISLCTCVGGIPMMIIGIIEGIKYLQMSDEDFYQFYKVEKKAWF